jgi:hypothetical protein
MTVLENVAVANSGFGLSRLARSAVFDTFIRAGRTSSPPTKSARSTTSSCTPG